MSVEDSRNTTPVAATNDESHAESNMTATPGKRKRSVQEDKVGSDNNTSATRRARPPPSTYDDESDDDLDKDYTPIRSTARSRTKRPIVEVFPAPSPNKPVGVANDAWKKFAWRNKNKALEGAYRATKGEDVNGGNVVFENDLNRPESATWDDNSGLKCGKCGKMQGSNQGSLRSFKRHLVTHKEDKDVYPCRGGYSKRLNSPRILTY